ncbi:MAG TPA: DoxX family protein [Agriterribacter sp.]|nr:DoxX family protein [Agriterribacter sp.]
MTKKTKKMASTILLVIPSFMVLLSGIMKISGNETVVNGLSQLGFGAYLYLLGIAEIIFVALLWIPKTWKLGFFLLLSYLGGAAAIEVAGGKGAVALMLIALLWAGIYVKNSAMFLTPAAKN